MIVNLAAVAVAAAAPGEVFDIRSVSHEVKHAFPHIRYQEFKKQ